MKIILLSWSNCKVRAKINIIKSIWQGGTAVQKICNHQQVIEQPCSTKIKEIFTTAGFSEEESRRLAIAYAKDEEIIEFWREKIKLGPHTWI